MVQVIVTTRDAYALPTTHQHCHCRRLRKGGREIVELGLLLRRKPAEDDGLEAGVGVLGDRLQTRLDHDLEARVYAPHARE